MQEEREGGESGQRGQGEEEGGWKSANENENPHIGGGNEQIKKAARLVCLIRPPDASACPLGTLVPLAPVVPLALLLPLGVLEEYMGIATGSF